MVEASTAKELGDEDGGIALRLSAINLLCVCEGVWRAKVREYIFYESAGTITMASIKPGLVGSSSSRSQRICNDAQRSVGLINVNEPVTQKSQEQQNFSMEDLLHVDGIAWDDTMIYVGLINVLDEPIGEEVIVGG